VFNNAFKFFKWLPLEKLEGVVVNTALIFTGEWKK